MTPVYAGIRDDLNSFLRAYLQFESVRFFDYKVMFENRGMVGLFTGRHNSAEIIEFNECLLVHCLPYMEECVCPGTPRSLKERLFGLYSLYTFYYIQQEKHVVKVRMDPDSSRNFRRFAQFLLTEKIYDAYALCQKLLEDKAIKHVAFISIHDPSHFKRFYTDDKVSGVSIRTNLNDPLVNVKALVEQFDALGVIHKEYSRLKMKLGITSWMKLKDPIEELKKIIKTSLQAVESSSGVDEIVHTDHSAQQLASRGMQRSSIKDQAHSAALKFSRTRRHRSVKPVIVPAETFEYAPDPKKKKEAQETMPVSGRNGRKRGRPKSVPKSKVSNPARILYEKLAEDMISEHLSTDLTEQEAFTDRPQSSLEPQKNELFNWDAAPQDAQISNQTTEPSCGEDIFIEDFGEFKSQDDVMFTAEDFNDSLIPPLADSDSDLEIDA